MTASRVATEDPADNRNSVAGKTGRKNTFSACLFWSKQIIDECNTQVGKMRQMEELICISQTLEFDKLKVGFAQ